MNESENPWPVFDPAGAPDPQPATAGRCPHCTYPVTAYAVFCEGCGAPLMPTEEKPADPVTSGSKQTRRLGAVHLPQRCLSCGGEVAPDGYCQTCGSLAPRPRDHVEVNPADWVGGVSDRGVAHHRNEDAIAIEIPDPETAVAVICDGVSTSEDSDTASLAGAAAAARALADGVSPAEAVEAAHQAVVAATSPDSANAAAATIVVARVQSGRVEFGHLGDTRIYWIPADHGDPLLLTVDDSVAQAFIAEGMPRAEAEQMPRAHAITRWIGRDREPGLAHVGEFVPTEAGWLLLCSDGLWNYASEPTDLAAVVAGCRADVGEDPLELARGLVCWAISQGGHDNISVALAACRPN